MHAIYPSRKKCMITNNNSSQLAATKENSMVWMEGRKQRIEADDAAADGIGSVRGCSCPGKSSQVCSTHRFVCM